MPADAYRRPLNRAPQQTVGLDCLAALCSQTINHLSFLARKLSPKGGKKRLAQSHVSKVAERGPFDTFFTRPKHIEQDPCNLAEEGLGSRCGARPAPCTPHPKKLVGGAECSPLEVLCQPLSLPLEPGHCPGLPSLCCCWVCLPFLTLHLEPLKPRVFPKDLPDPHPMPLDSRTDWRLADEKCMFRAVREVPKLPHAETLLAPASHGHLPGTCATSHHCAPGRLPSPTSERCPQPCRAHRKLADYPLHDFSYPSWPYICLTSLHPAKLSRCGRTMGTLLPSSRYSQIPGSSHSSTLPVAQSASLISTTLLS